MSATSRLVEYGVGNGHDLGEHVAGAGAPQSVVSAEIDLQIATARRFPRSLTRFRQQLQAQATVSEDVARQCHYAIPRAGKTIEGPSIRFAEMVSGAWGNCRVAARTVGETDNFVIAQGLYLDLETNVAYAEDVTRRITNAKGQRYDVDMIGVTAAAARSIAMRNAIFRGVPKAIWWDIYGVVRKTIVGDIKTMKQKREAALAFFKSLGIAEAQVFATLNVGGVMDIGPDQLITLAGFRTSIEDEGKDPESIFADAQSKTAARTIPAPPPAQADAAKAEDRDTPPRAHENPGGAQADPYGQASPPKPVPPTQGEGRAPPGDPSQGQQTVRPVFAFESVDAAREWAAGHRERLESASNSKAVRQLTRDSAGQLGALYAHDPDLAQSLNALAFDLQEAFAAEEENR